MSKQRKQQSSTRYQEEAEKIAQGTKKPGQTKEQTKLISQGIQKGIELYKSQQNAKNREIDKKRKQVLKSNAQQKPPELDNVSQVKYKQHWLPWLLLVLTWVGIAVYFYIV